MTCKDCIHSGLCYKENDYDNFPDRCGDFISDKVLEERPQGDLISREALKKAINDNGYSHYFEIFDIIDNAPTVEPEITNEDLQNAMTESFKNGYEMAKAKYERPQGEWQYTTHHARRYRICPFCNCEKEDDRSVGWFYCWHCGAKTKGGAE